MQVLILYFLDRVPYTFRFVMTDYFYRELSKYYRMKMNKIPLKRAEAEEIITIRDAKGDE